MRPSAERGLLDGERKRLIMAQERDDLVYLAKLAEQAERFDEMVERRRWTHMAYKNVIGSRRASWRAHGWCDARLEARGQAKQASHLNDGREKDRDEAKTKGDEKGWPQEAENYAIDEHLLIMSPFAYKKYSSQKKE